MNNYGLDLKKELREQSEEDYLFGSLAKKCIAQIPEGQRVDFLPEGELQRSDIEDMQDCASRAPVNIMEAKLTFLLQKGLFLPELQDWLDENGYIDYESSRVVLSDAFISINSGTTRTGNSMKAPLHAAHEF